MKLDRLIIGWLAPALVSAVFCQTSVAADPSRKAPTKAAKKANPNLLTREQLRACMDHEDRLRAATADIRRDEAALDEPRREVERIDADIATKLAALNAADEAAVQALRDEEARRNQLADDYNARLRSLRERAASHEADRKTWLEQCANKDFDEMDEAVIKRDRQRAAAQERRNAPGQKSAPR